MARKKPTYRKFRYWKKPTCKKGANNPSATINATVPRFIRDKYPEWSVAKLSAFTGLSEGYVRGILRNVYWSDGGPKRRLRRKPRLTEEQESAVIQLHYQEGWSDRKIAKAFGVSRGLIQYVLRGKQPYQTKAKKRLIVR